MTKKCECSCETRTCTFEPEVFLTRWDEDDNEVETAEPGDECGCFECSNCGFQMIYGYECGWFQDEPPYTPSFVYCPNCGLKVVNYYE